MCPLLGSFILRFVCVFWFLYYIVFCLCLCIGGACVLCVYKGGGLYMGVIRSEAYRWECILSFVTIESTFY